MKSSLFFFTNSEISTCVQSAVFFPAAARAATDSNGAEVNFAGKNPINKLGWPHQLENAVSDGGGGGGGLTRP